MPRHRGGGGNGRNFGSSSTRLFSPWPPWAIGTRASAGDNTLYIALRPVSSHPGQLSTIGQPAIPVLRPTCMEIRTDSLRSACLGRNPLNIRRFNMQTRISPTLTANPILTLEDLGLERCVGLDQASRGLAERSEAQIVRWVQFPAGALFFVLVPGDPESGAVYR